MSEQITSFFRRSGWIIGVCITCSVIAAFVFSLGQPRLYQSSTTFIVSVGTTQADIDYGDRVYGIDSLSKRSTVATYAEVVGSERIFDATVTNLGLQASANEYASTAVVLPETSIIRVSVTGPNPTGVANFLDELSAVSSDFVGTVDDVYELSTLDVAKVPTGPISPNPGRNVTMAGLVGLLLGVAIAIGRMPDKLLGISDRADDNRSVVSNGRVAESESRVRPAPPAPTISGRNGSTSASVPGAE